MQHINPSWHSDRNTRRDLSNQLKTNILCLAALVLIALMPSTGWAQTQYRSVSTPQQFSDALALSGTVEITITQGFTLHNGHTATKTGGTIPYNCLYLVAPGKKTIKGGGNTITRGDYKNNSIVLDDGAWLIIENLILDGAQKENYASMVLVPPRLKKIRNNTTNVEEYDVRARLEMKNCTIKGCYLNLKDYNYMYNTFQTQQIAPLISGGYEFLFVSVCNSGGAGVNFRPGLSADPNGNINNKITIENCHFISNWIMEGDYEKEENGGALALAGGFANGGTIKNCTFRKNYARNYGGAIWFAYNLKTSNGPFQFLGETVVGADGGGSDDPNDKNTSKLCGGGIAVEGGHVIFDGKMYIRYNTTGREGGGIYAEGGKLEFKSSGLEDFIDISYNEAAERGGGGICMKSYVTNPPVTTNLEVIAHDNCYMDISNNTAGYGGGICVGNNHAVDEYQSPYWSARIHFNSGSNDANSDSGRINIYQNKALQPGALDGEGGGGIFVREKSNVSGVKTTFTNCIVHDNIAKANSYVAGRPARGGGVAVVHSTALFDGCHIYNNGTVKFVGATGSEASDDSGGGVSVTQNHTNPTFRNCHIYNNGTYNNGYNTGIGNTLVTTLTSKGGGVFVGKEDPAVSFIGCRIYNNEAIRGGGLYMEVEGAKLKDACHVYGNRAHEEDPPRPDLWKHEKGGGGIYYKNGKFEGINYVYDNTTDSLGGGMFVYKPSNAEIQGLVIGSDDAEAEDKGNKAQRGGGIYAYSSDYAADATNYSLTINNCKIVYNQKDKNNTPIITGGGLWMGGKKSITVKLAGGTLIDHNKADNGGGVYVPNGDGEYVPNGNDKHTLELINTTLSNNIATQYGGGIYNDKQIVTSANNNDTITFHGNRAEEQDGGGIYNNENGQVKLTGTKQHIFTENIARYGGGIYNKINSKCSLNNCQIGQSGKGNVAASNGGGIYNEGSIAGVTAIATTTLLGDITFEDNHASDNGGGIFNLGKVTQEDPCTLTFDHNIANKDGGGVYHKGKPLTLTGAIFKNNVATMNGGGIYHVGDPLTLTNAIFKNNTATKDGGGIYTAKKCTLNNCKIGEPNDDSSTNSATNGGGIYKENDELTIQGGWVSHNTASNNGGGIYLERKNTLVNNNCRIQNNVATNNGGGIYVKGGEEGALQGGDYRISAFTVLGPYNDTVGWINRQEGQEFNNLIVPGGHVYNVGIGVGDNTIFEWESSFGGSYSGVINFDPVILEISEFWIDVYVNDGQPQIWDNGNYEFIARFKHDGSDDYFELGGNSIDFVNYGYYYEYYDETAQVVAPIVPTILTLNGSTVGGEAGKGNTADHDGGGIYIDKNAKVIMTSDTNGEYDDAIRNEVTHNQADHHGGGVYKDGTLQVEGHVLVVENRGKTDKGIRVSASPEEGGSVSGGGSFPHGSSCTVTAASNVGYRFVNWTENGNEVSTDHSYTFEVTGGRNLVANFEELYFITLSANPDHVSTYLEGSDYYAYGEECTVSTEPNLSNYRFVNWTENGTPVSYVAEYTFTVTGSRNLVANYETVCNVTFYIDSWVDCEYYECFGYGGVLEILVNNQQIATLEMNDSSSECETDCHVEKTIGFTPGTQVTVRWPNMYYNVSIGARYEDDDQNLFYSSIHYSNSYSYYTNTFTLNCEPYNVSLTANPVYGGIVSGGGTYYQGKNVVVTAYPERGYRFVNWTENGSEVSTSASYQFEINSHRNLMANFEALPLYDVTASVGSVAGGSVSFTDDLYNQYGDGSYYQGETCRVEATAYLGYEFVNWTENGTQVSTNAEYTFTVTGSRNLVANFISVPTFNIAATVNPDNTGSVSGTGTYNQNASCTLHAEPEYGFKFSNWTENGTPVSYDAEYTFPVTGNRNLVANFVPVCYVTFGIYGEWEWTYDDDYGEYEVCLGENNFLIITANGEEERLYNHDCGDNITKEYTPGTHVKVTWGGGAGYNCGFSVAYDGMTLISEYEPAANFTYEFDVDCQPLSITATANPSQGGTVRGGGTYANGAYFTLSATPNRGYKFVNWTKNGTEVSTNPSCSFSETADATYVANFQALPAYNIASTVYPEQGGTVSGTGLYYQGETCTVVATPAPVGFKFVRWTENGRQVSTSASYTFPVTGNRNLVAFFTAVNIYTINTTANPAQDGTVVGGGTFNEGTSCTLKALPKNGYAFDHWTRNGTTISGGSIITFTVTANATYEAHFRAAPGVLCGKFTINDSGDQVQFSMGNLQYQATTNTWRFAENQYDKIGEANENVSQTYDGWIDLFHYGSSGFNGRQPYEVFNTSPLNSNIAGTNYDWGVYNKISNGGNTANTWRTLTSDEWSYLLFSRSGPSYFKATVAGAKGLVLLPDGWDTDYSGPDYSNIDNSSGNFAANPITADEWATLEGYGAVFLPIACVRNDEYVENCQGMGIYWSSSMCGPHTYYQQDIISMSGYIPYVIKIYNSDMMLAPWTSSHIHWWHGHTTWHVSGYYASSALSVRLVRPAQ